MTTPQPHDIQEFRDAHKGERAFVLGNGWSVTYYNTQLLAHAGKLFGCNRAFEMHPLDYLVFQDNALTKTVDRFDGPVFCPFRASRVKEMRPEHTYFINFPRHPKSEKGEKFHFDFMNSGGLALQIAVYMGFKEIILVGCDCCFLDTGSKLTSNVFKDKHYQRMVNKGKTRNKAGTVSVKSLERFAVKFKKLYERFKGEHDIYRMGDWGIVDIPSIDFEDFWSDTHPGRNKFVGTGNAT